MKIRVEHLWFVHFSVKILLKKVYIKDYNVWMENIFQGQRRGETP